MKILYIIDAQNDFCAEGGSLSNKECIKNASNIVKLLKNERFDKIVCTLDTHHENYLDTLEGKKLPIVHCIEHSKGWQIRPDILEELDNLRMGSTSVIGQSKQTFGLSNLVYEQNHHYDRNDEIYICGFCTDICVISNALLLKSVNFETPITVIESCCAGVTPEKHNAAIEVMKSCQINIK